MVPHRLFGVVDGNQAMTAARFATLATQAIAEAHAASRLPILVGGTGLYLRTLLGGIAPVPEIRPEVRAEVRALDRVQARLALEAEDPAMAARLHRNDHQRNARALEVWRSTGRSLLVWQMAPAVGGLAGRVALDARVIAISREILAARINARVEQMWAAGALAEVQKLVARRLPPTLPVMRAIGVPPLIALLQGESDEAQALERWKLDTRQYAKRQATWLRHQFPGWQVVPASG